MDRWQARWAGVAGAVGMAVGALWRALPGFAGLALVSYGAWLAWPPAGFLSGGVLVLADEVADRMVGRRS